MCVDIARDAKSMVGQGKSLREVRSYVESKYSKLGPGTDTPPPPP
ncbi:MAG: hypothetical protein HYY01_05300 [Chloroflexi bacterium]|nr:hypothetical protein [Chloroflexota bacterium]